MTVNITLKTRQEQNGETDEVTLSALGTLTADGDTYTLRYTEPTENGGTAVCVTAAHRVTVQRRGETASTLIFAAGERHACPYETPYGVLTLYTACDELQNELTAAGGRVYAAYQLDTGDPREPIGQCTMEILVEEVAE